MLFMTMAVAVAVGKVLYDILSFPKSCYVMSCHVSSSFAFQVPFEKVFFFSP